MLVNGILFCEKNQKMAKKMVIVRLIKYGKCYKINC